MSEQLIIERGDENEALDLMKAQEVMETLQRHYPFHPWEVSFQGRVLVIRHLILSEAMRWQCGSIGVGVGFVIKHLNSYSSSELEHNSMLMGGQLLEMFGWKRGAWDGSLPKIPSTFKRNRPETFN